MHADRDDRCGTYAGAQAHNIENPDQIHDCEVFAETGTCPHLHPRYPNEFPDFVATWLNGILRIFRRVAELTRDEVTLA